MTPCIVLDLETTGFLLKEPAPDGWNARVVEVGAVVVTADLRIVSPISPLVRQPAEHLLHPRSRRAARVHGIPVGELLAAPFGEEEAAERLARWAVAVRERFGVEEIRGWNQSFDFRFLMSDPWRLFDRTPLRPGEDVRRAVKVALGPKKGGLAAAAAHRALADAMATAEVLVACERRLEVRA